MNLEDTLANLTIYDAKKYFRKAQNVVFNLTEMESKVREATNNEPWGASSTLMEQIAQGTFNFREREEIVGMIFKRFTEKTGSEWRQIYKALQLLEYLVKHGSEQFIDDVRSSLRIVKMLENFHYIDSQGRDQGINVRNKAKAMVLLLQDDNQLRAERKKARETANKYKGVMGGTGGNSNMNPRAGFSKSTLHSISVSADFDSDDEDDDQPPKCLPKLDNVDTYEKFTFKDEEPLKEQIQNNVQSNSISNNNIMDDEEDDEFSEFQTAKPITNNNDNTLKSLNFNSSTNVTNTIPIINPLNNTVSPSVPIVSQGNNYKTEDPFSSLFKTAKENKDQISVSNTAKKNNTVNSMNSISTSTTIINNMHKEDNDLFGDFTTSQPSANDDDKDNKNTITEEIDLLSF